MARRQHGLTRTVAVGCQCARPEGADQLTGRDQPAPSSIEALTGRKVKGL